MEQGEFRAVAGAVQVAVVALVLSTGVAWSHHGVANFDLNKELEITGSVTQIAFVNPHSWLYLDVAGEDGRVTAWKCELRGATVLRRSGWSPEMFVPGTMITITGAPDRFAANTCYLGTAVFADGTRFDRYGQIERPAPERVERPMRRANGHPNIAGDWAAEQRMLTDPRGMSGAFLPMSVARALEPGAVPEGTEAFPGSRGTAVSLAEDPIGAFWNRPSAMPLTEAGARAIAGFDGASSDNPRLRCEPTNILFDWTFEADVNRIVQGDDRITLRYGSMGLERTVYLDLTEHPADAQPSRAGHSIGRWEGDVLIVDTIGFEPGILSADGRIPHSDQLHVVERFSLDPETMALRRTYVAEDPLYFEGQYRGADVVYAADLPFQVATCDDRSFRSDSAPAGSSSWMMWAAGVLVGGFVVWLAVSRSRTAYAR
jgi:hypothetical protein